MSTKLATIIADFTTSLASAMAVGATTATLQSATDDDSVALPNGIYFFAIDGNNSQKEHIQATLTGTALTAISSISRQGVITSGCARTHRVGSTVTLTDFAHLKFINDLLKGTTDLDASTPLKYDGTASITLANQLATKAYVDGVAIAGGADASTTVKGISKLSTAPVSATNPIAVGDNDTRVPTQNENDALVGTSGTAVSGSNKLVDAADVSSAGASGKIVRASGTALPALDGSALTNVPASSVTNSYTATSTAIAARVPVRATTGTTALVSGAGTGNDYAVKGSSGTEELVAIEVITGVNGATITDLTAALKKTGSPADNISIEIRSDNTNKPSASVLATFPALAASTLTTSYANYSFTLATALDLAASTKYWIVFNRSGSRDASNYYNLQASSTTTVGTPTNGSMGTSATGTWTVFLVNLPTPNCTINMTDGTVGLIKLANAKNISNARLLGITSAAISGNATGSVVNFGPLSGFSGLTPGATYYIQDDGSLGTTAGTTSAKVGMALTTTTLFVSPQIQ